jgi:DNA repair protein SbcD/Mre11
MILAHLADLHLGFRAYHRVNAAGVNVRENDVTAAFQQAVEHVIALAPDLVLVAGDVFHTVRPSNAAIALAFRQFSLLSERLPDVPIVIIAGNHDSPRSADTGNILSLFREIPGVHVVADRAQRVWIEKLDTAILCLPHNALVDAQQGAVDTDGGPAETPSGRVALEPDPAAGTNILMLHGTVAGDLAERKIRYVSEYGGVTVHDSAIRPERWDYVALGHYHIATELTPNMWYAGGIERTSTTLWAETGDKGFVVYDTERRSARFQPLATRPVVDLPRLNAAGLSAAEVDARLETAVNAVAGGYEGKIIRLVVENIPRHVLRELNHRRIREIKAQALHFQLDARPPEVRRVVGSGAPARRLTLDEQVESYLLRHWQPSSGAIRRPRLVELGREYLERAGEDG